MRKRFCDYLRRIRMYWAIRRSGLFDCEYYLRNNLDVARSCVNPIMHYIRHGWREGRNPGPLFDTNWYLQQNPDVAQVGMNPLYHYLKHGWIEGRDPSCDFSTNDYYAIHKDSKEKGMNPLVYYSRLKKYESDISFPDNFVKSNNKITKEASRYIYFDPEFYYDSNADLQLQFQKKNKNELLEHYRAFGAFELRDPCQFFDSKFYFKYYLSANGMKLIPHEHYLLFESEHPLYPSKPVKYLSLSSFFDKFYYSNRYLEEEPKRYDAELDYIKTGIEGRRKTSPDFPLEIYEYAGDIESSCRISSISIDSKFLSYLKQEEQVFRPDIAVVIHAFYPELLREILNYCQNIEHPYDLYITTSEESKESINEIVKNCKLPHCENWTIQVVDNLGYDIRPFLLVFSEICDSYRYICKLHTKKTAYRDLNFGANWRKKLFTNLLGAPLYITMLLELFKQNPNLGMLIPHNISAIYSNMYRNSIGNNKDLFKMLCERLDLRYTEDVFFPAGSMFWARIDAIRRLVKINPDDTLFSTESSRKDGSFAHTIERLFSHMSEENHYVNKIIKFDSQKKLIFIPQEDCKPEHIKNHEKITSYVTKLDTLYCRIGKNVFSENCDVISNRSPKLDIYLDQNNFCRATEVTRGGMVIYRGEREVETDGLSICILNLNSPEYLIPLVDQLLEQKALFDKEGLGFEILIGDTGSTHEEVKRYYEKHKKDVTVIYNLSYNFSANNNELAFRYAQYKCCLFLNNDIIFPNQSNALLKMYNRLIGDDALGILGLCMYYPDFTIQHRGISFFDSPARIRGLCYHPDSRKKIKKLPAEALCPAVTGACMMVKRNVFLKCQGFDEGYQSECQDVALCLEILKLGYKTLIMNQGPVIHIENRTREKGEENWSDRRRFLRKYGSLIEACILNSWKE